MGRPAFETTDDGVRLRAARPDDLGALDAFVEQLSVHSRVQRFFFPTAPAAREASAAMVARQLMRAGFKRVRPLAGGFEAWVERGFAVQVQS